MSERMSCDPLFPEPRIFPWSGVIGERLVLVHGGFVAIVRLKIGKVECRVRHPEDPNLDDGWDEEDWELSVRRGKRVLFHNDATSGRITSQDAAMRLAEAIVSAAEPQEAAPTVIEARQKETALESLSDQALEAFLTRAGQPIRLPGVAGRRDKVRRLMPFVRSVAVQIEWSEAMPPAVVEGQEEPGAGTSGQGSVVSGQ